MFQKKNYFLHLDFLNLTLFNFKEACWCSGKNKSINSFFNIVRLSKFSCVIITYRKSIKCSIFLYVHFFLILWVILLMARACKNRASQHEVPLLITIRGSAGARLGTSWSSHSTLWCQLFRWPFCRKTRPLWARSSGPWRAIFTQNID